jgi:hypothetical protein
MVFLFHVATVVGQNLSLLPTVAQPEGVAILDLESENYSETPAIQSNEIK